MYGEYDDNTKQQSMKLAQYYYLKNQQLMNNNQNLDFGNKTKDYVFEGNIFSLNIQLLPNKNEFGSKSSSFSKLRFSQSSKLSQSSYFQEKEE